MRQIDQYGDTNPRGGIWAIVGSSWSMPTFLPAALEAADIVATCNFGLYACLIHERWPDYFGVFDAAVPRFIGYALPVLRRHGTRILCSSLMHEYGKLDSMPHDINLVVAEGVWPESRWRHGRYISGGPSGCYLTQFAVNNGARELHLVGMEGYSSMPSRPCRSPTLRSGKTSLARWRAMSVAALRSTASDSSTRGYTM